MAEGVASSTAGEGSSQDLAVGRPRCTWIVLRYGSFFDMGSHKVIQGSLLWRGRIMIVLRRETGAGGEKKKVEVRQGRKRPAAARI